MGYWDKRNEKAQLELFNRNAKEIQKQLAKYYSTAQEKILGQVLLTYNKVFLTIDEGREATPADLYKLDSYWQMQAQLKYELQKLGDKQATTLTKYFAEFYNSVYGAIAIPGEEMFSTVDFAAAKQVLESIWCADGKNWSKRIWENTERLAQTLNDELIHCVITGKKTSELKDILQKRFGVSYDRANTLVTTELANIQTQAARQRYEDAGLHYYEFLGREEHDIGCACKKLNGKRFSFAEMKVGVNAPPIHPNCRCAIVPVVDID